MPEFFEYLIKLSICIILVYLFYRIVLRSLTFYRWNRLYLLIYSLACFFIPFVDLSPSISGSSLEKSAVVQLIPVIGQYTVPQVPEQRHVTEINGWSIFSFIFLTGVLIFFTRLLVQYLSLLRIRKKASLFSSGEVKVYHVGERIIPFSFGNAIFLNQHLHRSEELQKIILHEYIHVKEKHTIDIIWAEVFLALNWYNPFAWMIRSSIRQNLEFIADARVLEEGVDKVHYQYLLLKVMGSSGSPVTNQFNFSSLKNRIVMMNKIRSARIHMARLLFILPLLAVLLLAFRNSTVTKEQPKNGREILLNYRAIVFDVSTNKPIQGTTIFVDEKLKTRSDANGRIMMDLTLEPGKHTIRFEKKGYDPGTTSFSIEPDQENRKSFIELHSLKKTGVHAEVSSVSLVADVNGQEINKSSDLDALFIQYIKGLEERKSGELLQGKAQNHSKDSIPGDYKAFLIRNPSVSELAWKGEPFRIVVYLKNGKKEEYKLESGNDLKTFEARYGKAPTAPPPPPPPPVRGEKSEETVTDALIDGLPEEHPLVFETHQLQWQPGNGLLMHKTVFFTNDSVKMSGDRIELKTGDNLLFMNGRQMSTDIIYTKTGEKFRLLQLTREAALKKYGDKARNGIIEIEKFE